MVPNACRLSEFLRPAAAKTKSGGGEVGNAGEGLVDQFVSVNLARVIGLFAWQVAFVWVGRCSR